MAGSTDPSSPTFLAHSSAPIKRSMNSWKMLIALIGFASLLLVSFNVFFDVAGLHDVQRSPFSVSMKHLRQEFVKYAEISEADEVQRNVQQQGDSRTVDNTHDAWQRKEEEETHRLKQLQERFDEQKETLRKQREQQEWKQQVDHLENQLQKKSEYPGNEKPDTVTIATQNSTTTEMASHRISGLSCRAYGGPSDEIAQKEMVYWEDIPSDSQYQSPFKIAHDRDQEPKYIIVEPDGGGYNNIRMSFEVSVVLAHAMGRIMVLWPEQRFYLLAKDRGKQKTDFSFKDFFHLDSLHQEHSGLDIISMEEFLQKEAMTGKLMNSTTGAVAFPPENRTDWNGQDLVPLKEYLRGVTYWRNWKPEQCVAAFPEQTGPEHIQKLHFMMETIKANGMPNPSEYVGQPVPVDAPPMDRLRENLAWRKELCVYDEEMQNARVVQFLCYHAIRARLLTHFYTFLFFENWKQDLFYKRFIRDHVRYLDELQCAAARIITAIRERARSRHPDTNPNGDYDSFHIRRGDFQYKDTRIEPEQIYLNSKDELTENATIYIATDERKKDMFQPLAEHYDVVYLDDFKHLIEGLNTNYYGMLDQLVASRGRVFFGTFYSTFTGYINRIRGYHASKNKLAGHEKGVIDSWYFVPLDKKNQMREYRPPGMTAFFSREFPTGWRDIDKGIGELQDVS